MNVNGFIYNEIMNIWTYILEYINNVNMYNTTDGGGGVNNHNRPLSTQHKKYSFGFGSFYFGLMLCDDKSMRMIVMIATTGTSIGRNG